VLEKKSGERRNGPFIITEGRTEYFGVLLLLFLRAEIQWGARTLSIREWPYWTPAGKQQTCNRRIRAEFVRQHGPPFV